MEKHGHPPEKHGGRMEKHRQSMEKHGESMEKHGEISILNRVYHSISGLCITQKMKKIHFSMGISF
jgi:hypothetical protein